MISKLISESTNKYYVAFFKKQIKTKKIYEQINKQIKTNK